MAQMQLDIRFSPLLVNISIILLPELPIKSVSKSQGDGDANLLITVLAE